MKIDERMYNYQSIMEESEDVQSFDIHTIDPIMNPYQTAHAVDDHSGNSKVNFSQYLIYIHEIISYVKIN